MRGHGVKRRRLPRPVVRGLRFAAMRRALSFVLLLAACDEGTATPADATLEAAVDAARADVPAVDAPATVDAPAVDAPALVDAPAACVVPAPLVAGTSATDALADAPARCGAASYRWLRDPSLGTITRTASGITFTRATLRALAAGANLPAALVLRSDVRAEVVGYTTQDRGRLLEATALVAWPTNLDAPTRVPTLLYLHGTAGFTDACAPSSGSDTRLLAAALASTGYVVVAPDYIGMRNGGAPTGFLHPYLVGEATAIASLDGVRAAARHVAAQGSNTCPDGRFASLGASQGGHAVLWVDRLQPYYAREWTHVGAVATVPPADFVGEVLRALGTTVLATANTAAFYAAAAPWYGLGARLGEVFLPPYVTSLPAVLATSCNPGDSFTSATAETVFTASLRSSAATAAGFVGSGPWACMAAQNGLTTTDVPRIANTQPGYGILYVTGGSDALVHTPTERAAFTSLCTAQSMPLQYLECAGASHTQTTGWALPEIMTFLGDRFAGRALDAARTCQLADASRCSATP